MLPSDAHGEGSKVEDERVTIIVVLDSYGFANNGVLGSKYYDLKGLGYVPP